MYLLAEQLRRLPVASFQTGQVIAWVSEPVINPDQLEVVAFLCRPLRRALPLALRVQDIRQCQRQGLIIDSAEELCPPSELVRLTPYLQRRFRLLGMKVVTELGQSLGRVGSYTLNCETYLIKKLHVRAAWWRQWLTSELIIDRNQVIDITPQQIVVRDTTAKEPLLAPAAAPFSE